MSGFHRMITYLYLYEQGTKSRNIGFAKVERRDQRCLLEIHMKNTGCSLSSVPIFLYVQKNAQLAGILLGNFTLTRGSGDFKAVINAENLKESGYKLDDVKGIYIPLTAQMMSVSQWDDDEFDVTNFVELSENETNGSDASKHNPAEITSSKNNSPAAKNTSSLQAAENSSSQDKCDHTDGAPTDTEPNQNTESAVIIEKVPTPQMTNENSAPKTVTPISAQTTANITNDKTTENNTNVTNSTNNTSKRNAPPTPPRQRESFVPQQDKDIPKRKPADALKAVEALPRQAEQIPEFHTIPGRSPQTSGKGQSTGHSQTSGIGQTTGHSQTSGTRQTTGHSQTSGIEQTTGHSQADEPENWDLRWRFILENYPVMTPFAGDENTLCVRMELKDLRQLPKQFWYLGNNSFLLHGFFNYRYFILGMTEEFGVKKWFIGVPGVFQNPERVMAALFGFPEFRSEKPSPINTGEFGYWYRYLNELSEPSKK